MVFTLNTLLQITALVVLSFSCAEAAPFLRGRRHSHSHSPKQVHRATFGAGSIVTAEKCVFGSNNMTDGSTSINNPFVYQMYPGTSETFPSSSEWLAFDTMFEANRPIMLQSCGWNNWGPDNSNHLVNYIKTYIEDVSRDSHIDPRAILAVIMQESNGCLRVPTTDNGVVNPGIMQSHDGVAFNPIAPCTTIHQMIIDGTQGTASGDGLVQLVNQYGDYYTAFRAYNSGSVSPDGNLNAPMGATPCYVNDIANRMLGWADGASGCTA